MTLQFASVSEIIGGSVLVEQVFSYPGLGQAAVAAGTGSDVPLLMGITLITAAIVFLEISWQMYCMELLIPESGREGWDYE
mgnify:CR=1 FL=1